jgi:arylsulfatase A-like enzyme
MTRHQTTRLRLLGTGLLLAAILGTGCQQTNPAASPVTSQGARPNIILIMTDDQGYGDLGVTGNPLINTPHIDALASRSAYLSDFYVSPVCAPTRASLMTGRYNYRTRVVDTFKGRAMMDPQEITLAETLRQAGYKTGIFGKWHLGDCYPVRPQDQGFDEALVHRGGGLAQPSEPIANQRRYTDSILLHNGEEVTTQGYCTDVYFEAAMKFIDQAQDQGSPFFVYIPPNAPHDPFHDVPEELYQKYKQMDLSPVLGERVQDTDKVARTFAMIENIDQNV